MQARAEVVAEGLVVIETQTRRDGGRANDDVVLDEQGMAARLHLRTPGDTNYLDWAKREWAWFKKTGMLTAKHQIIDGLTTSCTPGGPAYTYNQGVILGGLVELWRPEDERPAIVTDTLRWRLNAEAPELTIELSELFDDLPPGQTEIEGY